MKQEEKDTNFLGRPNKTSGLYAVFILMCSSIAAHATEQQLDANTHPKIISRLNRAHHMLCTIHDQCPANPCTSGLSMAILNLITLWGGWIDPRFPHMVDYGVNLKWHLGDWDRIAELRGFFLDCTVNHVRPNREGSGTPRFSAFLVFAMICIMPRIDIERALYLKAATSGWLPSLNKSTSFLIAQNTVKP